MQMLTLAGTIGRDAEIRSTGNGDKVAGFSVAIDNGKDSSGNRRDATWFDCSIWGKRAEALAPYLTKGTKVAITGRPGAREHNGKIYLQCTVDQITMQGGGTRDSGQQAEANQKSGGFRPSSRDLEDEIPFAPEWRI